MSNVFIFKILLLMKSNFEVCRITRLRPVAVDVSLGRVANFDKMMSVEYARWRHLRSGRVVDRAKVGSVLSCCASLPRAKKTPKKQH